MFIGLFAIVSLFFVSIFGDTLSLAEPAHPQTVVETVFVEKSSNCAYGREQILSFANKLYEMGDYSRASVEYLRYGFLYPDEPCDDMAFFRAGLCKEKEKKFSQARIIYRQLENSSDDRAKNFARYRIPLTYFLEDRFDSAVAVFDTAKTSEVYGALEYLRGWILLKQRKYSDALEIFKNISDNSEKSDIEGSLKYLEHRCRQGLKIPHRSPFLAGMFSTLVPGLGRGYCGRWGDGFFSFILVGAPAGLAAAMWDEDRTFSIVMASFATFFYMGNIYGSAKGASIYNEQKQKIFWKTTWQEVPHPPTMLYSDLKCDEE